ncbi:MAG: histidine kinase dimerization/phospho-acceptor domain-containing protein, partial [Candidatus Omnitrophota bacterium]
LMESHVEAEKLKTLKEMIITYNHHMNQPLTGAYMSINMFLKDFKGEGTQRELLEILKKEIDRISSILKKIRAIEDVREVDYVGGTQMIDLDDKGK